MLFAVLLTVAAEAAAAHQIPQAQAHHGTMYPMQPLQHDNTNMIILIACGFGALLFYLNQQNKQQQPIATAAPSQSSDLRQLQDTVRLLLENQNRQQYQQPPPPSWEQPNARSSGGRRTSGSSRQHSIPVTFNNAGGDESPTAEYSQANKNSSTSSPSFHATMPGTSSSGAGVPFELLQVMQQQQDSIKNLERKNRELNRQLTLTEVSNVVDVEKKYRLPVPVLNDDGSMGSQAVNLSASEIETIRAIFNMFDSEQSGYVSTKELQALHKQLGEPLTDEEARAAAQELDADGTGQVNFNKFLIWWYQSHSQGKKGSAYTQRFKLMHGVVGNFDVEKVITQDSGEVYTLEYRLNFYYKGHNQSLRPISPWHDIPLNRIGSGEQGQLFNFVCEIPKWTRAKFECATGELYNPIKQDTQHGKLRYYKHGDMMFNYGFFPQTWEDPEVIPGDTGCPGDNDPIDCVEIGATQIRVGAISAVKVLGLLGLIDDGETDWKLIAISIADPMAHLLNDIDDVEVHLPGAIKAIREYFRDYKSFSGKINTYALRAQAMPRHYAIKVLEETHQHWKSLHLVKKRHIIGESTHQVDSRKTSSNDAIVPAPTTASPAAPLSIIASPKLSSSSPRVTSTKYPTHGAVTELTGMDQPLDKLMSGK